MKIVAIAKCIFYLLLSGANKVRTCYSHSLRVRQAYLESCQVSTRAFLRK